MAPRIEPEEPYRDKRIGFTVKRTAISLLALATLTGCTTEQIEGWVAWYQTDPQGATDFANRPEVAESLVRPLTNNHAQRWERIAWCESGGQWHLRAHNRTGTYGGGLMIRDNVWAHYGGREYAATADQASKSEQIEIAERILSDVGWNAWDCA
jgi:Transglycosylase-like domain